MFEATLNESYLFALTYFCHKRRAFEEIVPLDLTWVEWGRAVPGNFCGLEVAGKDGTIWVKSKS